MEGVERKTQQTLQVWTVTHGILELKQAIPLGVSGAKITPCRFLYVLSALGNILGYESHDPRLSLRKYLPRVSQLRMMTSMELTTTMSHQNSHS